MQQIKCFRHDEASARRSRNVRNYLDATIGQQWIGRAGPTRCTVRSPNLLCLDFYSWNHMKILVYDTPVDNAEDLVVRISVAAGKIQYMAGEFENCNRWREL